MVTPQTNNQLVNFSVLVALCYVLIGFPFLSAIVIHSTHQHHLHHHNCQCGCDGDMAKCTCESVSGIVGFRFCTLQLNSIIPLSPVFTTRELTEKFQFDLFFQKQTFPVMQRELKAQEVPSNIDHPPEDSPIHII